MTTSRFVGVSVLGALAVAATVALWWSRRADPSPEGPVAAGSVEDDARVSRLAGRVAALEHNSRSLLDGQRALPPGPPSAVPASNVARQDREAASGEDDGQRLDRRLAALEGAFRAEPTDAAWSGEAERTIAAALAPERAAGLLVQSAVCRTSLCRLQLSRDGRQRRDEFLLSFVHALAWDTNTVTRTEARPDGRVEQVIYLSRTKRPLPAAHQ